MDDVTGPVAAAQKGSNEIDREDNSSIIGLTLSPFSLTGRRRIGLDEQRRKEVPDNRKFSGSRKRVGTVKLVAKL